MATRAISRPSASVGASVTKARFLAAVACPARAWWDTHDPSPKPPTRAARFRMDEGRRVHRIAQGLFPGGIRITTGNPSVAARLTRDLMADPETSAIFEAAFIVDGGVARPDVLVREPAENAGRDGRVDGIEGAGAERPPAGVEFSTPTDADLLRLADASSEPTDGTSDGPWRVVEVKSGTDPDDYLDDLAYTVAVARRAGVRVSRALLVTVNRDYTPGMPRSDLFVETDRTDEVDAIAEDFDARWDAVGESLESVHAPPPTASWACRGCPYFDTRCWGRGVDHPVFELPGLREGRWRGLMEHGAHGVGGIPKEALEGSGQLERRWRRVRACVREGRPWKSGDLRRALDAIEWPAYFLDFETVSTAIPLYEGVHPWDAVVTQYSLHVVSAPKVLRALRGLSPAEGGAVPGVTHRDTIADPARDCRRELAERLVRDLEGTGSVVVYGSFERTRLRELARLFPDLSDDITAVVARLVDLCALIRDHYYDARFHGSYSIKHVLPVLVPALSYDELAIGNGDDAMTVFAELARGDNAESWPKRREELLEYCALDTWAMVALLAELGEGLGTGAGEHDAV